MSDTQTDETAPEPGSDIANFSVTKTGEMADGSGLIFTVTFGQRKLSIRQLDLPSQWDLLEIASGGVDDSAWFNVATIAASVRSVDGYSFPPLLGSAANSIKTGIRNRLAKLGADGLRAASAALARMTKEAAAPSTSDVLATAGN